jgi:hypothetical protein
MPTTVQNLMGAGMSPELSGLVINLGGGSAPAPLAAVQAQIVPLLRDNSLATMGDSTFNGDGNLASSLENLVSISSPKGILRLAWGGGQAGQISTTIADNVLGSVVAIRPGVAAIMMGTNNPTAVSTVIADYTRCISRIRAAGIMCVVCTIMPITAEGSQVLTLNAAIRALAATYSADPLVQLCDIFAVLGNPSTGQWASPTYTGDGTHPSSIGGRLAAAQLQGTILPYLAPYSAMPRTVSGDAFNPITNGTFDQGSPSGGLASGWALQNASGTNTTTIVAPQVSDDLQGNWQQIVVSPNSGAQLVFNVAVGNALLRQWAGQKVVLTARVRVSGLEANQAAGGGGQWSLGFQDGWQNTNQAPGVIGWNGNWFCDMSPSTTGTEGFFSQDGYLSVGAGNAIGSFVLTFFNETASPNSMTLMLGEVGLFLYQEQKSGSFAYTQNPPAAISPIAVQNFTSSGTGTLQPGTGFATCNLTGGTLLTLTLPAIGSVNGMPAPKTIKRLDTTSASVTLNVAAADHIEGSNTTLTGLLTTQFSSITLTPGSDGTFGTCWYITGKYLT